MSHLRRSLCAALATVLSALTLGVVVPPAHADAGAAIRITEFAYGGKVAGVGGTDGEYVELTNVGDASQDLTGWTYDDAAATAATGLSLSSLGTVAPGESWRRRGTCVPTCSTPITPSRGSLTSTRGWPA